jgi:peroxiredoxin Q/BCP|tara:strand:- start:313 stop:570 length:258 start_codon:yes stop_codon:yes gene_type:complete
MVTNVLLVLLILWGIPSTYFRSKFRKIVYQTNDWKINIKPLFKKEIMGLFLNLYPDNKEYIRVRNYYRIYLLIYLVIFLVYYFSK